MSYEIDTKCKGNDTISEKLTVLIFKTVGAYN